jgi:glucose/arabinose dehydrogenase
MMRLRIGQWLTAFAACALAGSTPSAAAVKAVSIGTFSTPVYVAVAPGAPSLLFVVELSGRIQILVNEVKQAMPFLDITSLVLSPPDPDAGGEQGLLSIAFPPNYAQSGLFFVAFVNQSGSLEVDEFHRLTSTRADKTTRRVVITVPHPGAQNHNGGQMQFDPQGVLYISTGDGGGLSPPGDPARNLNDLRGKILRIDPLRRTGTLHYRIPPTNPFVGTAGRDEIYAYGFRNPWRFSLDNGRIAIGDVGQGTEEEVDFLPLSSVKGVNFGWPQYEGNLVYDSTRPGPGTPKFPLFTYDHTAGRCAVIGGYVLHDPDLPSLSGRYLYGDLCTGKIRAFFPNARDQKAIADVGIGVVLPGLSGFGQGFGGQIYVAQTSGAVSRLEPDVP